MSAGTSIMPPRHMVARVCTVTVLCICSLNTATFGQQPSPAAPTQSSLGDNIGRGFADSTDAFAEPSFDTAPDSTAARPHQQVLPRPQLSGVVGSAVEPGTSSMQVADIVVEGNTVLSAAAIEAVTAPFSDRELSPENLRELQRRLSLLYFNEGYVNSGVLLPEQIPETGTLTLQAVEGELSSIEWITPGRPPAYLEARLRRDVGTPLNVYDLQDSLRGLELNPLIRKVDAALVPGLYLGQAILQLQIEEAPPLRLGLFMDNRRSPSVGAERGVLSLEHLNLTGHGDRLAFRASVSEGLKDAYLDYTRPLNSHNTRLWFGYQRGKSEVIESPFDQLDIESDTESWGVSLAHPLLDRLDRRVELSLGLNHSQSETSLLGRPFSFSLGARNGEIAATHVSLGAEWIERGEDNVLALRTSLRYGTDWFGATMIPEGAPRRQLDTGAHIPESEFTVLLTQFQYARRLPWLSSQLVFSGVWQQAFDPLLSVEKMAIGGFYSVRGFRENQLVRDSGVNASLEWRVPLFANSARFNRWNLAVVPFLDYGRSWDHDSNLSSHKAAKLSSIGLGLQWRPSRHLYFTVIYGERIADDDIPSPAEKDLQDEGFHLALALSWPL